MAGILQQFKQKFESKQKSCPSCGAKISKTARICPECGDNFVYGTEEKPRSYNVQINSENCCSIFLLILIALAFLYVAFPIFKTILLIVIAAVAVIILAALILFAGLVYKIKRVFDFKSD